MTSGAATTRIVNYDGSIVSTPQQFVQPDSVEQLQEILRDRTRYPGPVRAMGSYHSLTPCASSTGTVVGMKGLKKVIRIDHERMTFTAQAGLQIIEAAPMLRAVNLQFVLNIEIGNMTLGSAACCHTKDSLDGVELGQVNSYVIAMKWVTPAGELAEASDETDPELMARMRGSYGLAGVVYEVTFRVKPLEIVRFTYDLHDAADLTQDQVSDVIARNEAMVCWTVGRTVVIQTRNRADRLEHEWLGESRRFGWNFLAAFSARHIRDNAPLPQISNIVERIGTGIELGFYRLLSAGGGFTLYAPDKIINYEHTKQAARYAFTFWAFPRADWVKNLRDYLEFADRHFERTGFRCNMPLGSYFVRKDRHSLLSYTYDGDVISLDPIHAPGERDSKEWDAFLHAFNDWSHARGGVPLLNQSPFVTKAQVLSAYGDRWKALGAWLCTVDPDRRMVNDFFAELLV